MRARFDQGFPPIGFTVVENRLSKEERRQIALQNRHLTALNTIFGYAGSASRPITAEDLAREATAKKTQDRMTSYVTFLRVYVYNCNPISQNVRDFFAARMREGEFQNLDRAFRGSEAPKLFNAFKEFYVTTLLLGGEHHWASSVHYQKLLEKLASLSPGAAVLEIGPGIDGCGFLVRPEIPRSLKLVLLDPHPFMFDLLQTLKQEMREKAPPRVTVVQEDFLTCFEPPPSSREVRGCEGRKKRVVARRELTPSYPPFQLLSASLVLRHIPPMQRGQFFEKAKELLAPGGQLIISDTHEGLEPTEREIESALCALAEEQGFGVRSRTTAVELCGETIFHLEFAVS